MQTISLKQPGDVVAMVPYLLGFHPEDSVVAVLTRRRQVVLTMRVDLPPPTAAAALGVRIGELCGQHGADELMLIGYGDPEPVRIVLEGVAEQVEALDVVTVVDVVHVGLDRWWSLRCAEECCPPQGRPYEPGSHPVVVEAVYAGLAARPDRASLEAEVAGPAKSRQRPLRRLATRAARELAGLDRAYRCGLVLDLVKAELDGSAPLDETDCVRLAVLVRDVVVRDTAWSLLTYDTAPAHRDLWRRVVASTVAPDECAPLCLLGLAAWVSGDGALLNCCIERVATVDPDYSLGHLLADISDGAVSPRLWAEIGPAIRDELAELVSR